MKVGIIGASFAKAAYLPALRHVPGAEVVALASARVASARSAASTFGVPHAYDDWEAMLASHEFDLVCIATPTLLHEPQTLAALAAGAHVLCEKPTAMDAGEAARMLAAAEAAGRVHMIDHELRFNPNRMRIADLICEGALGEILSARVCRPCVEGHRRWVQAGRGLQTSRCAGPAPFQDRDHRRPEHPRPAARTAGPAKPPMAQRGPGDDREPRDRVAPGRDTQEEGGCDQCGATKRQTERPAEQRSLTRHPGSYPARGLEARRRPLRVRRSTRKALQSNEPYRVPSRDPVRERRPP